MANQLCLSWPKQSLPVHTQHLSQHVQANAHFEVIDSDENWFRVAQPRRSSGEPLGAAKLWARCKVLTETVGVATWVTNSRSVVFMRQCSRDAVVGKLLPRVGRHG